MYKIKRLEEYQGLLGSMSTREDGNMSFVYGDEEDVIGNKKKFFEKLEINIEDVVDMSPMVDQPDQVVYVDSKNKGDILDKNKDPVWADALITDDKNCFLVVYPADCFGIIFYEPNKNVLALIHTGYIQIGAGIIKKTLDKLKTDFEIDFKDLITCITPGAHKCCLKYLDIVKPELKTEKAQGYVNKDGEYYSIDLLNWIIDDLKENNIDKIIENEFCSSCHTDKQFFSKIKQDIKEQEPGRNILVVGMV